MAKIFGVANIFAPNTAISFVSCVVLNIPFVEFILAKKNAADGVVPIYDM